MKCQFLGSRWPILNRWHLLRCGDCRTAQAADRVLARGVERLRAEPAPAAGLARAIGAFGAATTYDRAHSRRRQPILNHGFLPAGTLTALVGIGAAGWLACIDANPEVTIPTPAMPSPNAYDVLASAAKAIPSAERTVSFGPAASTDYSRSKINYAIANTADKRKGSGSGSQIPVRAHAARILPRSSAHANGGSEVRVDPTTNAPGQHFYTLAEKDELVRQYGRSLSLVREGFAYAYQPPPVRSFSALIPYLADDRQLARALVLDANIRLEHGDAEGAVSSCLDNMEFGMQISHGALLSDALTGIAIDAMGRKPIWPLVDRIPAKAARAAARRMERIIRRQVPFVEMLQEEKWAALAGIQELLQRRDWRYTVLSDRAEPGLSQVSGYVNYFRLLPYSKRRILDDYSMLMDAQIRDARKPYRFSALSTPRAPQDAAEYNRLENVANSDPIVRLLFPTFAQARFMEVASVETQHALLAAAFALRAYELEHHNLPRSLNDLVPDYLSAVPADPFGDGQPLRYHNITRTYSIASRGRFRSVDLYSVGPDGRDDGGSPLRNEPSIRQDTAGRSNAERDRQMFTAKPDSKGDIVAGVNIY